MKFLLLAISFLGTAAHASELTDAELLKSAAKELSVATESKTSTGATVVTKGSVPIFEQAAKEPFHELAFGFQRFQPAGIGAISVTETYNLESLSAHTIGVLRFSRWVTRLGLGERGFRWGLGMGLGIGHAKMNLISNTGVRYDDISLLFLLPAFGPNAEYYWPRGAGLAAGASAAVGRLFIVQSTSAPIANHTLQANFLEIGPYFKAFLKDKVFIRFDYLHRAIIGASEMKMQTSNYIASLGFGF